MKIDRRGFTLVELLVVISIIALLSSIVLTSISAARLKSRNNQRKQDLIQLRNALEIYYSSNNHYPLSNDQQYTSFPGGLPGNPDNGGDWIPGLVASGALRKLPQDPLGAGPSTNPSPYCVGQMRAYYYETDTAGTNYNVQLVCAAEGTIPSNDSFNHPLTPTGVNWVITNNTKWSWGT